jgi:hypothetical protein
VKQSESKRGVLPVALKPGAQFVFKKVSRIRGGVIVTTVSYLDPIKTIGLPTPEPTLLVKFTRILKKFRGALRASLGLLTAK